MSEWKSWPHYEGGRPDVEPRSVLLIRRYLGGNRDAGEYEFFADFCSFAEHDLHHELRLAAADLVAEAHACPDCAHVEDGRRFWSVPEAALERVEKILADIAEGDPLP